MRNSGRIIILATAAAGLAACTNPDGSVSRTGTGAAIGAAAGGLVGNLIGDSTAATAAGAAVGGMAGTAIGADLDRQQHELQQSLGGSGASVVNTGSQLVVTLPESITFDTGSATVHPDYVDEIALVAGSLRQNPNSTVLVVGHTDNVGSTEYNQGLSERRAQAVAAIVTTNGVESWRLNTVGRGYGQPVASNDTPGGRAQNRRVEIFITPIAGKA